MTETSNTAENDTKTDTAFENYDLKAEAEAARKPSIRFAFEFPDLLDMFRPADDEALQSRRASRIAGIMAVSFVLFALMFASLGPVLAGMQDASHGPAPAVAHDTPAAADHAAPADAHATPVATGHASPSKGISLHTLAGSFAAALGLIGTVLGISGMRRSASRRKWLHARLTTETLRLFHFHYMAARMPEIIAVAGDNARRERYIKDRTAAFERLKAEILADPEKELQRIITRGVETPFEAIVPMMKAEGAEIPEAARDAFAAWRLLRLDWQGGYCAAKLEHRKRGRTTTKQLEEMFAGLGWFCVGAIILIHIGHFIGVVAHASSPWLEVAVIWIALIALASRAMEDGFQPQREIERYEQYRANIRVATERFEAATTFAAKLETLRAFERTSLEEMRVFLRTHARARFLL